MAAIQLIDGTRWLVLFVPLVVLLLVWLGQAVHAHRRAIALGAAAGGELQVALFLPFALTVLTVFWLVGGRHGSPSATVEAYMAAWMDGRADVAATLYSAPRTQAEVEQVWQADSEAIMRRLTLLRATYGPASGLDPQRPFGSLRVREIDEAPSRSRFVVEIVRSERFQTTVLGVIPTAAQRTVSVEPMLDIVLREVATPPQLGVLGLHDTSWRVESVEGTGL
jgi:hypothetical protein